MNRPMAKSRDAGNSRETRIVGLISDTHGMVRPEIAKVFAGVTLIVHAGDVGGPAVLASLSRIAPVEAVGGNVDDPHDPMLPAARTIPLSAALILHVTHGHELGRPTVERVAASYVGDVLVFGHTHRPVVARRAGKDGQLRLVVNPGAAGPRRFDIEPTVALLTISDGSVEVEIVPLVGSRANSS
jgi:putative phosphoesterase